MNKKHDRHSYEVNVDRTKRKTPLRLLNANKIPINLKRKP